MRTDIVKKYENLRKQQLIDILASMSVAETPSIGTPSDVYNRIINCLPPVDFFYNEYFFTVTLNGAHQIIDTHIISKGLVNRTMVHPREVFRPAIIDNATAIIIAHNHPSGSFEPSIEDKDVTKRIKDAGDLIGIRVLDHLIFSTTGYLSLLESALF